MPALPPRWDLLAFDFDGTLADSFDRFVLVHNQLAGTHGFRRIEADQVGQLRQL
jgi:phosphoglycolate phosphatase